jgi:hypothetical protein
MVCFHVIAICAERNPSNPVPGLEPADQLVVLGEGEETKSPECAEAGAADKESPCGMTA